MKHKKRTREWEEVCSRINLAGVLYSDYCQVHNTLKAGSVLQLVGQPHNKFDNMAISVRWKGKHIGFIPRYTIHQSECWNSHRAGYKLIAVLTGYHASNPTWCKITVQIKRTKIGKAKKPQQDVLL